MCNNDDNNTSKKITKQNLFFYHTMTSQSNIRTSAGIKKKKIRNANWIPDLLSH